MATTGMDAIFSFLDDDGLTIPGVISRAHPRGKDYLIPSPDAETGIRLNALAEITTKMQKKIEVSEADAKRVMMDDAEERTFMEQVLTAPLLAQLIADGVSWERIKRINQFAFTHFAFSAETARDAAAKGVFSGKAPAQNRAARRAPRK